MNGLREKANNPSQSTGYSQLNQVAEGKGGVQVGKLDPVSAYLGRRILPHA